MTNPSTNESKINTIITKIYNYNDHINQTTNRKEDFIPKSTLDNLEIVGKKEFINLIGINNKESIERLNLLCRDNLKEKISNGEYQTSVPLKSSYILPQELKKEKFKIFAKPDSDVHQKVNIAKDFTKYYSQIKCFTQVFRDEGIEDIHFGNINNMLHSINMIENPENPFWLQNKTQKIINGMIEQEYFSKTDTKSLYHIPNTKNDEKLTQKYYDILKESHFQSLFSDYKQAKNYIEIHEEISLYKKFVDNESWTAFDTIMATSLYELTSKDFSIKKELNKSRQFQFFNKKVTPKYVVAELTHKVIARKVSDEIRIYPVIKKQIKPPVIIDIKSMSYIQSYGKLHLRTGSLQFRREHYYYVSKHFPAKDKDVIVIKKDTVKNQYKITLLKGIHKSTIFDISDPKIKYQFHSITSNSGQFGVGLHHYNEFNTDSISKKQSRQINQFNLWNYFANEKIVVNKEDPNNIKVWLTRPDFPDPFIIDKITKERIQYYDKVKNGHVYIGKKYYKMSDKVEGEFIVISLGKKVINLNQNDTIHFKFKDGTIVQHDFNAKNEFHFIKKIDYKGRFTIYDPFKNRNEEYYPGRNCPFSMGYIKLIPDSNMIIVQSIKDKKDPYIIQYNTKEFIQYYQKLNKFGRHFSNHTMYELGIDYKDKLCLINKDDDIITIKTLEHPQEEFNFIEETGMKILKKKKFLTFFSFNFILYSYHQNIHSEY